MKPIRETDEGDYTKLADTVIRSNLPGLAPLAREALAIKLVAKLKKTARLFVEANTGGSE